MGLNEKIAVKEAALQRIKLMEFGEPITNVCAGDNNPRRHAYFCQLIEKTRTNRFGVDHTERLVKCTDRCGRFWNTGIEVIFAGHLDYEKCQELFHPIWQAMYE